MIQRVAIYGRYSSEKQSDSSIEDQFRKCDDHAIRQAWQVVARFADRAISGATDERPDYQALLKGIRARRFDIVMAESLDRFSRDQTDMIELGKLCRFHDARLVTLADGNVSKLDIGFKGLMSALYLDDLAAKTVRGLEGRVLAGRGVGTPPYGYRLIRRLDERGEPDRGLWEKDPAEALVVERIFALYADGATPRQIARTLNKEAVPSPGGRIWYDSAIRGQPERGDGILRNETYRGLVVWGRRHRLKDPETGRSTRRKANADDVVQCDRPDLRIVSDQLWANVQNRLAAAAVPTPVPGSGEAQAFWGKRRPRHLLTGKAVCGCCGRTLRVFGQDYLRCEAAYNGGCRNRSHVRRSKLEAQVLQALRHQLMAPELVAACITAFNTELATLSATLNAGSELARRELKVVRTKIANLIDAISDGRSSSSIMIKLGELEAQEEALAAKAKPMTSLPAALHPAIATVYADRVAALQAELVNPDNRGALEAARALIDRVVVHPPETDGDPPGVEVIGELIELLKAAGIGANDNTPGQTRDADVLGLFASSVKDDPRARPLVGLRGGALVLLAKTAVGRCRPG